MLIFLKKKISFAHTVKKWNECHENARIKNIFYPDRFKKYILCLNYFFKCIIIKLKEKCKLNPINQINLRFRFWTGRGIYWFYNNVFFFFTSVYARSFLKTIQTFVQYNKRSGFERKYYIEVSKVKTFLLFFFINLKKQNYRNPANLKHLIFGLRQNCTLLKYTVNNATVFCTFFFTLSYVIFLN